MKTIVRIISTQKRLNREGRPFYLSLVELEDGEQYSLAGSAPPKIGEAVESFFDSKYDKPKAVYPKH